MKQFAPVDPLATDPKSDPGHEPGTDLAALAEFSQSVAPDADRLSRLAKLAEEQVTAERMVAQAEESLKKAKDRLQRVSEVDIPGLMDECGLSETKTASGITIKVKTEIRASVSEAKDADRFQRVVSYLTAKGQQRLVKNKMILSIDLDDVQKLPGIRAALAGFHLAEDTVEEKRDINHQSLSAYVRKSLEAGDELPEADFGVFRDRRAIIKVD